MRLWSGFRTMSNFCIVCTPRSGSYYFFEYMSKTFDLVEDYAGNKLSLDFMDETAICLCLERFDQIKELQILSSKWLKLIKKNWCRKDAYKALKEANIL